jgi:hypothetical protein
MSSQKNETEPFSFTTYKKSTQNEELNITFETIKLLEENTRESFLGINFHNEFLDILLTVSE